MKRLNEGASLARFEREAKTLMRLCHTAIIGFTSTMACVRHTLAFSTRTKISREPWRRTFLNDIPEHARTIELTRRGFG